MCIIGRTRYNSNCSFFKFENFVNKTGICAWPDLYSIKCPQTCIVNILQLHKNLKFNELNKINSFLQKSEKSEKNTENIFGS